VKDSSPSWRKKLYPEYKANRAKRQLFDSEEQKQMFFEMFHAEVERIRSFIPQIWVLECEEAEGDDIIAVLTKYLYENMPQATITVMSSDHDYYQLHKYGNISQFDPKKKEFVHVDDPAYALQTKLLCGDSSDNIPNVRRGFAEVKAMDFYNKGKLDEFLSAAGARERYDMNRQLIDFDFIPPRIVDRITDLIVAKRSSKPMVANTRGLHNYYIKSGAISPVDHKLPHWYAALKAPTFGILR
jgi:5'-3' exonuclease